LKVTVFNGSPRAEKSNTNIIAQAFLEGAKSAGADVDNIFLIKKSINHCTGCFSCWFKTPGKCVFNDDMNELMEKYMTSDIICLASPVYTWNVTAALKNFVDRLIPTMSPAIQETQGKYDMEKRIRKIPDSVVIANSGFPGHSNFEIIKEVFKPANPVLEIYRNAGHILKNDQEEIKRKVNEYLSCVKESGLELVKNGTVSDQTKKKLQMELVDSEEYVKMIHKNSI
jgi:multimeric flavodoxin WrbA